MRIFESIWRNWIYTQRFINCARFLPFVPPEQLYSVLHSDLFLRRGTVIDCATWLLVWLRNGRLQGRKEGKGHWALWLQGCCAWLLYLPRLQLLKVPLWGPAASNGHALCSTQSWMVIIICVTNQGILLFTIRCIDSKDLNQRNVHLMVQSRHWDT